MAQLPVRSRSTAAVASALAATALLSLGLSACQRADAQATASPPPPPEVQVATPVVQMAPEWSEHPGRFTAVNAVEVRPRVSGYLQSVHFKDGEFVRQGQLLFTIDPLPFRARADGAGAEVAQAEARLDRARSELRRAEALRAANAVSVEEFDAKREAFAQAEAAVQAARADQRSTGLDLGYTRITAPISGRISDRRVDPGNLVQNGQTVLTSIVAVDPIHFEFAAPEGLLGGRAGPSLSGAREVLLQLEGETGFPHRGRLDFLDNAVDASTGTIRGRAVFANADRAFTPGQFGRVRLLSAEPERTVLVPDTAVGTDQSRRYVLVVGPQNKVEYRQVELGPTLAGLRVIRTGLKGSERIVIDGIQRAMPGQPVTPLPGRVRAAANGLDAAARG